METMLSLQGIEKLNQYRGGRVNTMFLGYHHYTIHHEKTVFQKNLNDNNKIMQYHYTN